MRVAFVSMETTHHRETAGARRLERLARMLANRGHEVSICCARWWDDEERDSVAEDGVVYRAVSDAASGARFSVGLFRTLWDLGADVVHASPRPPAAVPAARLAGVLTRTPLVVEWFGDEALPNSWLTDQAARLPACVVTPSEMVRTRVREHGAPTDATRVIPESIDVAQLAAVDPAADAPDVVFSHRLDDGANVDSLLLALAELRDHDWTAAVVGDGPTREDYEAQAVDLQIDDRVTFVGEQSLEDRLALYRGAHAFVQTARKSYFATELLWALAAGCVGIVEYQAESSAHELIENYDRSFRVTSPQELADAIAAASEYPRWDADDEFERYDHDHVLEEYLSCYRDLQDAHGVL